MGCTLFYGGVIRLFIPLMIYLYLYFSGERWKINYSLVKGTAV